MSAALPSLPPAREQLPTEGRAGVWSAGAHTWLLATGCHGRWEPAGQAVCQGEGLPMNMADQGPGG